jgi:predicted dehydrogenase
MDNLLETRPRPASNQAARRLRLIQVGLGFWGSDWAQEILPSVETVEVVGYVDPSGEALRRLQSSLAVDPASCFPSLAAALETVECDAVLASLPTAHHAAVVRQALGAGKHVIVEKPFASSLPEALELVDLAAAKGLVLKVSQNYRHFPASIAAAELIASGELGEPHSVTVDFRRYAPTFGVLYPDIPDPLLADMSVHHFDLMRMVLGQEPVEVSCRTWNPPGSPFTYDAAGAAIITFSGGTCVSYRGTWMTRAPQTPWGGEWTIDCASGFVTFTCRGDKAARLAAERLSYGRGNDPAEPLSLPQLRHADRAGTLSAFAQAVLTGVAPARFSSGADNIGTFALVHACLLSARNGGCSVKIEDVVQQARAKEALS